jgi:CBS domain containing-hemolysin-like protein
MRKAPIEIYLVEDDHLLSAAQLSVRSTSAPSASPNMNLPRANIQRPIRAGALSTLAFFLAAPTHAHASLFQGETLDAVANGISWVAIIIAPIIGIAVFWLVHILPEKIAHKKKHPQTRAIQCLCLLSLVFGGLLWPIAWLWAYSKPVLHRLAYGTDVDESLAHSDHEVNGEESELEQLRARVAELEAQAKGGKA